MLLMWIRCKARDSLNRIAKKKQQNLKGVLVLSFL